MTLNELAHSVYALTLDEFGGVSAPFIAALNRAVRRAFSDFSPTAVARLYTGGVKPTYKIKRLVFSGEGEHALSLTGKAYSMRLWGKGSYIHTEGGLDTVTDFDSNGELYTALIPSGSVVLTFIGNDPYTVTDIVTFGGVRGGSEKNIPDGKNQVCLDLRLITKDFLSFAGPVTDEDGAVIKEAFFSGSCIVLPSSYEGEVSVTYNRLPERITLKNEGELDLPDGLIEPIVTLTASLLLTEDSPELSERLFKMYERDSEAAGLAYKQTRAVTVVSDGWA